MAVAIPLWAWTITGGGGEGGGSWRVGHIYPARSPARQFGQRDSASLIAAARFVPAMQCLHMRNEHVCGQCHGDA